MTGSEKPTDESSEDAPFEEKLKEYCRLPTNEVEKWELLVNILTMDLSYPQIRIICCNSVWCTEMHGPILHYMRSLASPEQQAEVNQYAKMFNLIDFV